MQLMRNRLPLQKSSLPDQRWLHNCFLKKLWISSEKFQMLKKKKNSPLPLFFSPPPRDATLHFRKSNGVVNHEFAEVYTVRASCPFSALHGEVVLRSLLWKFRPPYTRADSEIAAPACIFAYMKKKERKWKKKSLRRRQGEKRLADYGVTRGKIDEITQRKFFSCEVRTL